MSRMDRKIEKLRPDEKELIGKWIEGPNNRVIGDTNCERVQALTDGYLERMGVCEEGDGWDTLFIDPEDGRYWERIYMESYMHGGGPPSLFNLSEEEAKKKYPKLF